MNDKRCVGVPKLLDKKSPIQGASGSNREAESTDAPARGGLLRSSDEASVMLVERRERAIAIGSGQPATGGTRCFNGRRQPSRGGTSRMTRECQVRFCEGLGVKFPGVPAQKHNPWGNGSPLKNVAEDFAMEHLALSGPERLARVLGAIASSGLVADRSELSGRNGRACVVTMGA